MAAIPGEYLATYDQAMFERQTNTMLAQGNKIAPLLAFANEKKDVERAMKQAMQQQMAPPAQMERPVIELPAGIQDLSELPPLDLTHLYVEVNLYEDGLNVDEQQLDQREKAVAEHEQDLEPVSRDAQRTQERTTQDLDKADDKEKRHEKTRDEKGRTQPGKIVRDGQDKKMEQQLEQNQNHQLMQNNDIRKVQEVASRETVVVSRSDGKETTATREVMKERGVENTGGLKQGKGLGLGDAMQRRNDAAFAGKTMASIANLTQDTHRTVELKVGSDTLRFEHSKAENVTYAFLNGEKVGANKAAETIGRLNDSLGITGKVLVEAGIRHAAINPAQTRPVNLDQAISEHNRVAATRQEPSISKVRTAPTK